MAPHKNDKPKTIARQHPTGVATGLTGAIVTLAAALGVEVSPEVAAAIVTVVGLVVSAFTPREV